MRPADERLNSTYTYWPDVYGSFYGSPHRENESMFAKESESDVTGVEVREVAEVSYPRVIDVWDVRRGQEICCLL